MVLKIIFSLYDIFLVFFFKATDAVRLESFDKCRLKILLAVITSEEKILTASQD